MLLSKALKGKNLVSEKAWIKHITSLKTRKKPDKTALKQAITQAVKQRIPKKRFGILFSGGIDSSLIALICKQTTTNFICYSVGLENATDLEASKKAAKKLKLKLKTKVLSLSQAEQIIKKVTKIVGPDVVKTGVGSVVYTAALLAKKDKINNLFSGLGSEEEFAGYERHLAVKNINKACWKGLKQMWKKDLTRDFAIAKNLKVNILTPFLDPCVIKTAMQIPGNEKICFAKKFNKSKFSGVYTIKNNRKKFTNSINKQKITKQYKKVILRKIAQELGLPKEIAWKKKKAAQYGSKFDRAIYRLAKRAGFKYKKDYLESLYEETLNS